MAVQAKLYEWSYQAQEENTQSQMSARPRPLKDSLPQGSRGEELCDEIDCVGLLVQPGVVECHDILVLQLFKDPNLCKQAVTVLLGGYEVVDTDLVPSYLHSLFLVKTLVHRLEGTSAKHMVRLQRQAVLSGFDISTARTAAARAGEHTLLYLPVGSCSTTSGSGGSLLLLEASGTGASACDVAVAIVVYRSTRTELLAGHKHARAASRQSR